MTGPVPVSVAYENARFVAIQQSNHLARSEPQLIPTFFFIDAQGHIEIVGWLDNELPRLAMEKVREIAKRHNTVAVVFVSEVDAVDTGRSADGIVVAGFCPEKSPEVELNVFRLDHSRRAFPAMNAIVPDYLYSWMKEIA